MGDILTATDNFSKTAINRQSAGPSGRMSRAVHFSTGNRHRSASRPRRNKTSSFPATGLKPVNEVPTIFLIPENLAVFHASDHNMMQKAGLSNRAIRGINDFCPHSLSWFIHLFKAIAACGDSEETG
jgi:hypothetical protein